MYISLFLPTLAAPNHSTIDSDNCFLSSTEGVTIKGTPEEEDKGGAKKRRRVTAKK
jgi:hypothetical protein